LFHVEHVNCVKMKTKYIVWVKTGPRTWEPNGDGPMTEKTALRIAAELRRERVCDAHVLPEGVESKQREAA
jgi:hypothetical protein